KSDPEIKNLKSKKEQDKYWGVICLQPEHEIIDVDAMKKRLYEFSSHVCILIEKAIYKKRFTQLDELNEEIQNINMQINEQEFYDKVVNIVQKIIQVEA